MAAIETYLNQRQYEETFDQLVRRGTEGCCSHWCLQQVLAGPTCPVSSSPCTFFFLQANDRRVEVNEDSSSDDDHAKRKKVRGLAVGFSAGTRMLKGMLELH